MVTRKLSLLVQIQKLLQLTTKPLVLVCHFYISLFQIEIGFCNGDSWMPTIRMQHLCDLIISILNYPQAINALRKDIAEQMIKSRETFNKEAANFAKSHAEVRP